MDDTWADIEHPVGPPTHLNRLETLQALQKNPVTRAIPVILLTAKTQTTEPLKLTELGVAAVIPKPFKAMQLSQQGVAA